MVNIGSSLNLSLNSSIYDIISCLDHIDCKASGVRKSGTRKSNLVLKSMISSLV